MLNLAVGKKKLDDYLEKILYYIQYVRATTKGYINMNTAYPNHFSHKFRLPLGKAPTKKMDRLPLKIIFSGCLFGALLAFLGGYDLWNSHINYAYESLLNINFFDIALIVIGCGIIANLCFAYFKYKKIYYDGKNITVVARNGTDTKSSFREPIKNYEGVRFRIEFFAYGFINRNKYIIELYHKNPSKIVPLLISTRNHNIRKCWEDYAKAFNLPAMIETDEGLVIRQICDFGKSVKEMSKAWNLKDKFNPKTPVPKSLIVKNKDRKLIIKIKNRLWDAYTIIGVIFTVFAAIFSLISFNLFDNALITFFGLLLTVMSLAFLLSKEKLILKKYKIINVHKFIFSRKKDEIDKTDIEAVDVTLNPATGRHYITIISDKKTIIFGKKLPIEDLRWLKNFLLYELSK